MLCTRVHSVCPNCSVFPATSSGRSFLQPHCIGIPLPRLPKSARQAILTHQNSELLFYIEYIHTLGLLSLCIASITILVLINDPTGHIVTFCCCCNLDWGGRGCCGIPIKTASRLQEDGRRGLRRSEMSILYIYMDMYQVLFDKELSNHFCRVQSSRFIAHVVKDCFRPRG